MRTIGLIGGTSWHSTIEYYRGINQAINDRFGNNTNPPLILHSLDQHEIHRLQAADRWDAIAGLLANAAAKLEASGAEALVFCANTPHKVYPEVASSVRIPILHIADAVGSAVRRLSLSEVGLIGTRYTMEDGFIQRWLLERYGVTVITPSSDEARSRLQRIIQLELALGDFGQDTKRYVIEQISILRARGAQGIVLGCTEFPLLLAQHELDLPSFDTLQLHARMAVDFILS